MKEKYLCPAVVNASTLYGEGIIPLMKIVLSTLSPNAALMITSPPPAQKAHGTPKLIAQNSSLTERKFKEVLA